VVAGRLLGLEAMRCDQEFQKMLQTPPPGGSMFTLSLDGWSNCRMQSLYAFAVITRNRETHLLGLHDFSIQFHTAEFIAGRFYNIDILNCRKLLEVHSCI
jgi:hypothetical protein